MGLTETYSNSWMTSSLLYVFSIIVHAKEAYLLIDLFRDLVSMCEEYGLEYPPVSSTKYLKRELVIEFGHTISFFTTGRNMLVHNTNMNPCNSCNKLERVTDEDILKAFGKLVERKTNQKLVKEGSPKQWPLSPEDLAIQINEDPLPVLRDAILATLGIALRHLFHLVLKQNYGFFVLNGKVC